MIGGKHTKGFKDRHAEDSERIVAAAPGYIGKAMGSGDDAQHNGELIVTDRRVVFYRKGFFGEVLETIPLKMITSVEQKSLLGHRTLKLHTSHDSMEFKCMDKSAYQTVVASIDSGRKSNRVEAMTTSGTGDISPLDALKKLGELRDAGVISEEEFAEKKQDLMDRI